MDAVSDEVLWQRVLSGDADSFGVVWDRHRDRILAHLLSLGTPADEAEDLTATVFLELWRKRRSVRFVDGSLLPWLLVTALNVSRNAGRARSRYRSFLARLPSPEPVADPADSVAARLDPDAVRARQLIQESPVQDRQLVALTALGGCTVREAAAVLDLSESAAKMRLSRLRARAREYLSSTSRSEEAR